MNKVKFINSLSKGGDGLYVIVRGQISVIVFHVTLNTRLNAISITTVLSNLPAKALKL